MNKEPVMQPAKKIHPGVAALIVIVLVGIVTSAIIVINNQSSIGESAETTTTEQATPATTDASTSSDSSTSSYKDGTYNATGSYSSPGGRESIELTVTIASGVITSTSLAENATSGEAKGYQEDFASGYKNLVVGKNVDEVSLSRVAGSSLTSNGFNAALEQIKSDAKA